MSKIDTSNIIKAMECHRINACHKCPYEGLRNCIEYLCDDAVALVKKLGEENEWLKSPKYYINSDGTSNAEPIP